jgi:GntR family transcriptional regulator
VGSTTLPAPKYAQIAERIISEIRKGRLPLGSQIPSQKELMSEYGVSTTTARKVLQELERVGWVTRIRGRGTFVRQQTVARPLNRILSFTRNMVESGRVPSTKVLALRVRSGARTQRLPIGEFVLAGPMYEVRRLRLADGVPMAIETRYVSMQLCPKLNEADLSGSLLDIYEQQYGLRLTRIDQMLMPTPIDEEGSALLDVEESLLGIRVEGVVSAAGGTILELEESLYRGDLYRFYVTATHY